MQEAQQAKVFFNNRTQAVRIPVTARFDESVEIVTVRVVGQDRILSPINNTWDSFFMGNDDVSSDFMSERPSQEQAERESF